MKKTFLIKTQSLFETHGLNYEEVKQPLWEDYHRLMLICPEYSLLPADTSKIGDTLEFEYSDYDYDGYRGFRGIVRGVVLFIVEE